MMNPINGEKCHKCHGLIKGGALLIFAISAAFFVYYYSQSVQPGTYRSFSVTGEGRAITVPDVAQFTFSVISQGGKDVVKTQQDNTKKVNAVIAFLKENGIDAKDIKTQGYNVDPQYQYYECRGGACPPPTITGYNVTQTVLVKIRNFDKTGDILSGVVAKGANSVSQLSFVTDDPTGVKSLAREEAIKKAKDKAEEVAKAAGFKIGKLIAIDEGGYYQAPLYNSKTAEYGMGGGADSAAAPAAIEPGSEEVLVNITLRYEIK
jgi:hypothetical protein